MESNHITAVIAQFPVTLNTDQNAEFIKGFISGLSADEVLVLPEGALSGYAEDASFLNSISQNCVAKRFEEIKSLTMERGAHVFLGNCEKIDGEWVNLGVYLSPDGDRYDYQKINLASFERGAMKPGNNLPVFEISIGGRPIVVGVQLCREIRYAEQWQLLSRKGAEIIVFLNNAVGDALVYPVWRSHLISRAAENQRYVLASNNAHQRQKCPSMVIAPSGQVIAEIAGNETSSIRVPIDLDKVFNWTLDQARLDVLETIEK